MSASQQNVPSSKYGLIGGMHLQCVHVSMVYCTVCERIVTECMLPYQGSGNETSERTEQGTSEYMMAHLVQSEESLHSLSSSSSSSSGSLQQ